MRLKPRAPRQGKASRNYNAYSTYSVEQGGGWDTKFPNSKQL